MTVEDAVRPRRNDVPEGPNQIARSTGGLVVVRTRRTFIRLGFAGFIWLVAANAQSRSLLTATRNLVIVPTTVVDSAGKLVFGLNAQDVSVFEEGKAQTVTDLWLDRVPVSLGIVLDVSGSMKKALPEVRSVIAEIMSTVEPQDEVFLLCFRDDPRMVLDFGDNSHRVQEAIMREAGAGGTALWDALILGMHHMRTAHRRRRAILLFSDGGDMDSRYTWAEVQNWVREADVRIYPFLLPRGWNEDDVVRLRELAEESGRTIFRSQAHKTVPGFVGRTGSSLAIHDRIRSFPTSRAGGISPHRSQADEPSKTSEMQSILAAGVPLPGPMRLYFACLVRVGAAIGRALLV